MTWLGRHAVLWGLALTLLCGVFVAPAVSAQEPSDSAGPDLSYVTPNAVVAVFAYPSRVLKAPGMEMLPHEIITAAGKQELGLDPADIEEVLVVAHRRFLRHSPAGPTLRAHKLRSRLLLSSKSSAFSW